MADRQKGKENILRESSLFPHTTVMLLARWGNMVCVFAAVPKYVFLKRSDYMLTHTEIFISKRRQKTKNTKAFLKTS